MWRWPAQSRSTSALGASSRRRDLELRARDGPLAVLGAEVLEVAHARRPGDDVPGEGVDRVVERLHGHVVGAARLSDDRLGLLELVLQILELRGGLEVRVAL